MIKVRDISAQTTSKKVLLDGISLTVKPGTITAIVGKNGAGKSTLLKVISGDIPKHTGEIYLDEVLISTIDIGELAKRRAIMAQKTSIEFSFSAKEIVSIGRTPFTGLFTSKKDDEIILTCMKKADVLHLKDQNFTTLSGGEQQRVHFARALAQVWGSVEKKEPSYLLLDEPLASIDVSHQHKMMRVLRYLSVHQTGILIVVHDLNLAAQYADIIHILKDGKTVVAGSPNEVFTEEIIASAFDYPVSVIPHPKIRCPLIIASGH
ncbi:MAG: heme ABC transporter ATP-binding protein [Balneolaceae bacterium]